MKFTCGQFRFDTCASELNSSSLGYYLDKCASNSGCPREEVCVQVSRRHVRKGCLVVARMFGLVLGFVIMFQNCIGYTRAVEKHI